MNIHIKRFGVDMIQTVNWFYQTPMFGFYSYPSTYKDQPVYGGKPIFWGVVFAWLEIRVFPLRKPKKPPFSAGCGGDS